jgi:predicted AlkP superfamily phosphohydrolase/phosphomutase
VETGKSVCEGNAFWEYMEKKDGARSAILFVPMTYPVWRTNGIMVAGTPLGSTEKDFIYPEDLPNTYRDCFLGRDVLKLETAKKEQYVKESLSIANRRGDEIVAAIRSGHYDVVFGVHGATDRSAHIFWKYREPVRFGVDPEEQAKYASVVDEHYIAVDRKLGEIMDAAGEGTLICLLSDHGAGPVAFRQFHLNRWLHDNGYFREKRLIGKSAMRRLGAFMRWNIYLRKLVHSLPGFAARGMRKISSDLDAIDAARTKAFRVPMWYYYDGVEINLKGRQENGTVDQSEYERLREEIMARLVDVKDPETGKSIVVSVHRKEDLFAGEGSRYAPDIIVAYHELYEGASDIHSLVSDVPNQKLHSWSGTHRLHGILGLMGGNIRRAGEIADARIEDLTPTILYAMGYPIPGYMTGRVLTEAFTDEFVREHPPLQGDDGLHIPKREVKVSDAESERMREQLRGLGYIE